MEHYSISYYNRIRLAARAAAGELPKIDKKQRGLFIWKVAKEFGVTASEVGKMLNNSKQKKKTRGKQLELF